ncbi:Bardet-Biedl syndrome 12 protein [Brienomyrus brachyistius]|uniref:Bardet-Biedl syndrome 12 protein n=1 Tax=Brienomyrus brachyistius TaxID=42636 RepID=UPI0020B28E0F|nr:Bardet-Biedl syndrome 12 protein [Brienomyrus brachyistius]XP_048852584.1 Bardet-Biedl syndrome 12 protein [Brienomyrus brachyistius]XP_048852585.1 Bardet-Biedl syndrome 12 protein [Brienomyrus brachyistius]XP_048852586.1 Bardet-Biedl syndrome 12 protein [Brienomyrus brachyistius]XP_048852587.1 Bardet-Biedl syndrome 12 protein [Brienomyrus brachyistius]
MSVYGCRVVRHPRHVGLQQLVTLAASARSFLGPEKRYKFVVDKDDGGSTLACSPLRLLESMDTGCAVAQLFLETVQAHLKSFHTGTATLAFMVGAWSAAALECLHEGIPVHDVVSSMTEGLELCSEACQMSCVPLKEVVRPVGCGPRRQENSTVASDQCSERVSNGSQDVSVATCFSHLSAEGVSQSRCLAGRSRQDNKFPIMIRHNLKLRHSRHFSQKEETTGAEAGCERSIESSFLPRHNFEYRDIAFLANTVCHGSDSLMKLVTEASRIQTENARCGDFSKCVFDVSKLVTCLLPGFSEECSCVASGLVTFMPVEQASIIDRLKDQNLHVALISGDLSEKYRHLGYNKPSDIRNICGSLNPMKPSRGDKWVADVSEMLLQLKVNVLLVNGVVSKDLAEDCFQHSVLIVERVRPEVLKDFAKATGAIPVTYATQLCELCVGGGVQVTFWGGPEGQRRSKRHRAVGVRIGAVGSALVTVVIASAVQAKLQALEDCFWGCAYRLHHALLDRKLLSGAGVTEMLCVKHLLEAAEDNVTQERNSGMGFTCAPRGHSPYRSSVLRRMSRGWVDYVAMLMFSTGECPSELEACTVLGQELRLEASRSTQLSGFQEQPSRQGVGDGQTPAIYDNVTVKLEAWRRALGLVLTVLQTDMEIITGISTTDIQGLEDFLLL